jgi:hypothetical protein
LPSPSVVAIFGPTASGKTAVAEAVADRIGGEVVSADSMQAYRGLPILTAQPERPTRLVGIWPLSHEGSVAEYADRAHAAIDELLSAGRTPVVAGGTGLYLRAALVDLGLPPAPPPELRSHWEELYDRLGAERAHEVLVERDPGAAARLHANDRRRVVRALELTELGSSLRPAGLASGRRDCGTTRSSSASTSRATSSLERIERARRRCSTPASSRRRRRARGDVSSTAIHALGLREVADLPRDEALDALIVAHAPLRRVPAQVDAAHSGPC